MFPPPGTQQKFSKTAFKILRRHNSVLLSALKEFPSFPVLFSGRAGNIFPHCNEFPKLHGKVALLFAPPQSKPVFSFSRQIFILFIFVFGERPWLKIFVTGLREFFLSLGRLAVFYFGPLRFFLLIVLSFFTAPVFIFFPEQRMS